MKVHQLRDLRKKAALTVQQQLDAFLFSLVPSFKAPVEKDRWRREIRRLRSAALSKIYLRGWPRDMVQGFPKIVWGETLRPDPSYVIRKLRFEAFSNYWIPALLYEPTQGRGKLPAALNADGHHQGGKAATYKQIRCANLARRGVLALNFEFVGMGELGGDMFHNRIGLFDLTGMAGVGVFYLAMSKALDVLLAHPRIDKTRVAMTGLSGGGWQTIVLAALDPRITLGASVAGYTSVANRVKHINDIGDWEQVPPDLTTVLDYQTMTAMLVPRPALLICNEKDDCCFLTDRTRPVVYDAVRPTYRAFGALDCFEFHNHRKPGNHNYGTDNRSQFYRFINRHFGLEAPVTDMHRPQEIYPESELEVGLPPEQTCILSLARQRTRAAVSKLRLPRTATERRRLRQRLARVVRLPQYKNPTARITGRRKGATLMRLHAGPWSLPMVLKRDASVNSTWLIISDQPGEFKAPPSLMMRGTRVFVDVLGIGAASVPAVRLLLVQTVGQRVLGIQAAQILAAAHVVAKIMRTPHLCLFGNGAMSALACLVAAALEPSLFRRLAVTFQPSTLIHPIEYGIHYEEFPSLFCPDLLTVADVPHMVSLLEGVEYVQPGRFVRTENSMDDNSGEKSSR